MVNWIFNRFPFFEWRMKWNLFGLWGGSWAHWLNWKADNDKKKSLRKTVTTSQSINGPSMANDRKIWWNQWRYTQWTDNNIQWSAMECGFYHIPISTEKRLRSCSFFLFREIKCFNRIQYSNELFTQRCCTVRHELVCLLSLQNRNRLRWSSYLK